MNKDQTLVMEQLAKIEFSNTFRGVPRERELLRFLVEQVLAGNAAQIKAGTIASQILKRKHPDAEDLASARALGGRVRKRLPVYYQNEGGSDRVRIVIPSGSYVPEFKDTASNLERPKPQVDDAKQSTEPEATAPFNPTNSEVHPRIVFFNAFGNAMIALEEQRWSDVFETASSYFALGLDEAKLHERERKQIPRLRLARFMAMTKLKDRHPQLTQELAELNIRDAFPADLYSAGLSLAIGAAVKNRQRDQAVRLLAELLALLSSEDDSMRLAATQHVLAIAKGITAEGDCELAVHILRDFTEKISRTNDGTREYLAEAQMLMTRGLKQLKRMPEALAVYAEVEQTFTGVLPDNLAEHVAWAGTEAIRALRALNRHGDADSLVTSLQERFSESRNQNVRRAREWAIAEQVETLVASRNFDGAVRYCSGLMERWQKENVDGLLSEFIAWGCAERGRCLLKGKRYLEAIETCDGLLRDFGSSNDADVQFQVVWGWANKIRALRKLRRLRASMSAADELLNMFPNAADRRIIDERRYGLHAKGDALVFEAKLLMQNDLREDATHKLQEACHQFTEVAEKEPSNYSHFACRSYAEFLLGRTTDAEASFAKAVELSAPYWLDGDEWTELSSFPVLEDQAFLDHVKQWVDKRPHLPSSSTSL